jgi:hypothetical protein
MFKRISLVLFGASSVSANPGDRRLQDNNNIYEWDKQNQDLYREVSMEGNAGVQAYNQKAMLNADIMNRIHALKTKWYQIRELGLSRRAEGEMYTKL